GHGAGGTGPVAREVLVEGARPEIAHGGFAHDVAQEGNGGGAAMAAGAEPENAGGRLLARQSFTTVGAGEHDWPTCYRRGAGCGVGSGRVSPGRLVRGWTTPGLSPESGLLSRLPSQILRATNPASSTRTAPSPMAALRQSILENSSVTQSTM